MIQRDDLASLDWTISPVRVSMIVARDIRVTDFRRERGGTDPVSTGNSAPVADTGTGIDRSSATRNWTDIAISRLGFPSETVQLGEPSMPELEEIQWVGTVIGDRLRRHGFETVANVAMAAFEELTLVRGIGERRARQIRHSATQLLER